MCNILGTMEVSTNFVQLLVVWMTFLLWGTSVFLPDSLDAIGKGEEYVF